MKEAQRLKGRRAVVIGGSRGINKAVAKAFLKEGARVILVARLEDELDAAKKELSALGEVGIFAADASLAGDMERLRDEVKRLWGGLDILVNGAAVSGPIGPVIDIDPKEWEESLGITLTGTFHGIRFLGPMMAAENSGVIINYVGGGEGPLLNYASYVAAKGGIARLTETAAKELEGAGVRMNAIAPGAVNTRFLEDLLSAGPERAGRENYERALRQKASGGTPPEKAANLCVWLASDASLGVTGKVFSALWDPYEDLPKHLADVASTDVYTMRRVRPKNRGFAWDPFDPL